MEIIKQFAEKNPCFQLNKKRHNKQYITFQDRGPVGIVLYSVGCAQPSAQVFAKRQDKYNATTAVHAFLQSDGTVYQTLPWNYMGWHVGGAANLTHIGVKMTEPGEDYTKEEARKQIDGTYQTAVELFAWLCKKYNIKPSSIMSHREAGIRGLGSKHEDLEKLWSTYNTPYTMDKFRQDVHNKIMSENF